MSLYLIFMGVQGAGKGMQAGTISETYNIPHVSTGDLFRAMRTREDDLARKIQQIMAEGRLVSDADTAEVLRDRLERSDAADGFILDGFPRNVAQAEWVNEYLAERGEQLTGVLYLSLDLYTAFKRAFGRVTASNGDSYNIYYNADGIDWEFTDHPEKAYPPRLEARVKDTGEMLKRRPDDANAHAVLTRIDTYIESTQPLIDYYRDQGLLIEIDADQPIDAVTAAITEAIGQVQQTS